LAQASGKGEAREEGDEKKEMAAALQIKNLRTEAKELKMKAANAAASASQSAPVASIFSSITKTDWPRAFRPCNIKQDTPRSPPSVLTELWLSSSPFISRQRHDVAEVSGRMVGQSILFTNSCI